jgi:hypothetical protein
VLVCGIATITAFLTKSFFLILSRLRILESRILILGNGLLAKECSDLISGNARRKYHVVGFFPVNDEQSYVAPAALLKDGNSLADTAKKHNVREIVVSVPNENGRDFPIQQLLDPAPVPGWFPADIEIVELPGDLVGAPMLIGEEPIRLLDVFGLSLVDDFLANSFPILFEDRFAVRIQLRDQLVPDRGRAEIAPSVKRVGHSSFYFAAKLIDKPLVQYRIHGQQKFGIRRVRIETVRGSNQPLTILLDQLPQLERLDRVTAGPPKFVDVDAAESRLLVADQGLDQQVAASRGRRP